jgi:hypothetical protein
MNGLFNRARRAAFIAAVVLLSSGALASIASAVDVEILPDLVYGHKDGLAMTLDVIKPKTGANGAAILYMVSGGWVSTWSPPQQMATRFQACCRAVSRWSSCATVAARGTSCPMPCRTYAARSGTCATTRSSGAWIRTARRARRQRRRALVDDPRDGI